MANFFDQFDGPSQKPSAPSGAADASNFFDQFDGTSDSERQAAVNDVKRYFQQQQINDELSTADKLLIGAGERTVGAWRGIKQLVGTAATAALGGESRLMDFTALGALSKVLSPEQRKQVAQVIADDARGTGRDVAGEAQIFGQLKDESPWTVGGGQMLAEVGISTAIPGGALAKPGIANAMLSGAIGEGLQYSEEGLAGHAKGAAGGAAAGAVGGTLFKAAAKSINAVRSRFKDAATQSLMNDAASAGVPLTLPDVAGRPGGMLASIDQYLAKLPIIGTGGLREVQAGKARQMLEGLRDSYKRYAGDGSDAVLDGLFKVLNGNKSAAKKMYDEVGRLTQGDIMPLTAATANANRIMQKMRADFVGNESLISPTVKQILAPFEKPLVVTFDGARKLRSQLKTDLRSAMKNGLVGDEETRVMGRVLQGIEADIAHWGAQKGGAVGQKLKAADRFYRENVVPFKDTMVAKVANSQELDLMLPQLLANPVRARKLYAAAGQKGQDAIRYTLLDDALEKAVINKGTQNETLSPTAFVRAVDRMKASFGEAFKGAERRKVDGVTTLMRHLKGVDKARSMPQSAMGVALQGAQFGGPVAAGYLAQGPAGAAAMGGALGALRLAFGTNQGTRLIMAASDFRRDPAAVRAIWNSLQQIASKNYAVINGLAPPDEDD